MLTFVFTCLTPEIKPEHTKGSCGYFTNRVYFFKIPVPFGQSVLLGRTNIRMIPTGIYLIYVLRYEAVYRFCIIWKSYTVGVRKYEEIIENIS